jgi:hypothetical protein
MKKILFILSLMLCVIGAAYSQSNTTYYFQYTFGDPSCNPDWSIWNVSHGSPSYADYSAKLVSSYTNNTSKSEGLYVDYNFSKNNNYQIYFAFHGSGGQARMEAYGANGLTVGKDAACNEAVLPNVSDKQLIAGVPVYPEYLYEVTIPTDKPYWNPNKNYKSLWITSNNPTFPGYFLLYTVIIKDFGKVESNPPTTPGNLRTTLVEAKKITVKWDPSTDDTKVAGYEVYLNNNLQGTTANTEYTFTRLTECTNYKIDVRAFDPYDNYSPKASITVRTPIDLPGDLVLDTPIDLAGKEVIKETTNSITLKAGFSVKANTAQEIFRARVSSGCPPSILSVFPEDEEKPYFIGGDDYSMDLFPETDSTPTVLSDVTNSDPLIYPNPTSNMITVEYHQFTGTEKITMFDIMGKPLLNYKLSGEISNIDLSAFSSGIYFIKIITENQVLVRKLTKQ